MDHVQKHNTCIKAFIVLGCVEIDLFYDFNVVLCYNTNLKNVLNNLEYFIFV
jgi:hypothetical protein